MKISIVGASNSVMLDGYAYRLSPQMHGRGVPAEVRNFSLGASPCLRGLVPILRGDVNGTDAFVIEFAVTDYPYLKLFTARIWAEAYEALIRNIIVRHPGAQIICLILGRRDPKYVAAQNAMRAHVLDLEKRYGVTVVDFDAALHDLLPEQADFAACYGDHVHYQAPLSTALCAKMLCDAVTRNDRLPPSISGGPQRMDDLRLMDLTGVDDAIGNQEFANSKFRAMTARLEIGQVLRLPRDVLPVGIEFVSHRESCDIEISRDDDTYRMHTLHKAVATGAFGFLVRFATMQVGSWDRASDDTWTIRAVGGDLSASAQTVTGMLRNDPTRETSAGLSTLLYLPA